jgi:hypothetical protein
VKKLITGMYRSGALMSLTGGLYFGPLFEFCVRGGHASGEAPTVRCEPGGLSHRVQCPVPLAPDAEREEQHPQLVAHVAVVHREVVAQLVACRRGTGLHVNTGRTDTQTDLRLAPVAT